MSSETHDSFTSCPVTPDNYDATQNYLANIAELIAQITPRKQARQVEQLHERLRQELPGCQYQDRLNKRALDDQDAEPAKRQKSSRGNRTVDLPDADKLKDLEKKARAAGRRFVLVHGLWFALGTFTLEELFAADPAEAPTISETAIFDSEQVEEVGLAQLQQFHDILPEGLEKYLTQEWFAKAVNDGMNSQRSNTHTRLRSDALSIILEGSEYSTSQFKTPSERLENFKTLIGQRHDTGDKDPHWSAWHVPLLHTGATRLDFDQVFRGPFLLKVWASVIRGRNGSRDLMEGGSKLPQATCMQRKYQISSVTPGMIASSAILAIWLFSPDTNLLEVGDKSGIEYGERFRIYLRMLIVGLNDKKEWARGLFSLWDKTLFPEVGSSAFGESKSEGRCRLEGEVDEALALQAGMPAAGSASADPEGDHDE